jgi:hypothetical protein
MEVLNGKGRKRDINDIHSRQSSQMNLGTSMAWAAPHLVRPTSTRASTGPTGHGGGAQVGRDLERHHGLTVVIGLPDKTPPLEWENSNHGPRRAEHGS